MLRKSKKKRKIFLANYLNNVGLWIGAGFTLINWYVISYAHLNGDKIIIYTNTYGEGILEFYMMPFISILVMVVALKNTKKARK